MDERRGSANTSQRHGLLARVVVAAPSKSAPGKRRVHAAAGGSPEPCSAVTAYW